MGDPPKLLGYAGKGALRGLLKVTATRTAISMLRKGGRVGPGDDPVLDPEASRDFEASFLKERYRGAFREAFEAHRRQAFRRDVDATAWNGFYRLSINTRTTADGPQQLRVGDRLRIV